MKYITEKIERFVLVIFKFVTEKWLTGGDIHIKFNKIKKFQDFTRIYIPKRVWDARNALFAKKCAHQNI